MPAVVNVPMTADLLERKLFGCIWGWWRLVWI